MISELMDTMTSWFKNNNNNEEQQDNRPVLEQIEELNQRNKAFYDSPNHHKNILKLFIPFQKPKNRPHCHGDNTYNREYVIKRINDFLDFLKEEKLFTQCIMEEKQDGVYMAFLFSKALIEIHGGGEYTSNDYLFEDLYKKQSNNQMSEDEIVQEINKNYNKKWHYAKTSSIQLAERFFGLRNHKQYKKDGTEEWFGDILNYSENNIGTYEQNKQWNKHLNQWKPDEVKKLEAIFEKEDYSTYALGNENVSKDLIIYNIRN